MKNVKIVLVVLVVSLLAMPATSFGWVYWAGGGTTSSWSEAGNWADGATPPSNDWALIGNGQTAKVPVVDSAGCVASDVYVGHNRYGWAGPGQLTIASGDLTIGNLKVGVDWNDGAVTQTGGDVTIGGELALGHESNFGSYNISGGSLDAGAHILMSDAGTSSAKFTVDGSGATSITSSYQLGWRNGTGELEFILDAIGVTQITTQRMNLGTGVGAILTIDASAYTGPEADIVLVDYYHDSRWDGNVFDTINLSGGATSIDYQGGAGNNQLTVHVVPEPATMLLLGLGGLVLRKRRA